MWDDKQSLIVQIAVFKSHVSSVQLETDDESQIYETLDSV